MNTSVPHRLGAPESIEPILLDARALVPSPPLPVTSGPARKKGQPFDEIRRGSVTVKIYGRKPGPWTITWRENATGPRQATMRAELARAETFAEEKATEIANGETWRRELGHADYAEFLHCRQLAQTVNVAPSMLITEALAARVKNSRTNIVCKDGPGIVEELLAAKSAEAAGVRWIADLKSRLHRFAQNFPGPLHQVSGEDLRLWLTRLNLGKRSWNNNRTALLALSSFARERNYVPADWDALATVKPFKLTKGEEELYTPEEMRTLLFTADKYYPQHVATLAIMGFAGLRHCELRDATGALDWRDVHLSSSQIHISESLAKSNTGRRYAPIQPNLAAWLRPYVKPRGPVCGISNLTNAFQRLAKRADLKWKQNALRNSFVSYRCAVTQNVAQVASEAGNSVAEIHRSYRKELTDLEGAGWFAIWPTRAESLPLFEWSGAVKAVIPAS